MCYLTDDVIDETYGVAAVFDEEEEEVVCTCMYFIMGHVTHCDYHVTLMLLIFSEPWSVV